MNSPDPALSHLADSLVATVEAADSSRLREYLSGRKLPAMGGDLDPADVFLQTIPLIQEPSDFRNRLARILATLIETEAAALEGTKEENTSRLTVLQNALYLAAELPAEEVLFNSLKKLLGVLRAIPQEDSSLMRLQIPLWQALVFQQTDASLEAEWFSILESSEGAAWSPKRRTFLLMAWQGLLWIPPAPERRKSGEIVDFERIERGLLAMYETSNGHEKALSLLQVCIERLQETYPRSAEFWASAFMPRVANWPQEASRISFLKLGLLTQKQKTIRERSKAYKLIRNYLLMVSAESQVGLSAHP